MPSIENGENVVWLNRMTSGVQLRHVYAGAGVFVFPSLYGGFGIPVVEAFASGVPVIASNTTSIPEVSAGAAIDVDPLSVAALGGAMLELARDEALRRRCIAAGTAPAPSFADGLRVQRVLAAIEDSAGRDGCRVEISEEH